MSTTSDTVEFQQDASDDRRHPDGPPEADRGSGQSSSDRGAYRAAVHRFRSRRRLAATVVAVILAVVASLVAIEVISRLADRPAGLLPTGWLSRLGRETRWDDALTLIAAVVACLLGLLLLALAILPGRSRVVPVSAGRDEVLLALRPATLAKQAVAAAEAVPGVDHADASASRSRLWVRAQTPLRDPGDLTDQIRKAVSERVDEFAPLRQPRLQVELRHRKD